MVDTMRAPEPSIIAEADPGFLENIALVTPPDSLYRAYHLAPHDFLEGTRRHKIAELVEAVSPLAKLAIEDYEQDGHLKATDIILDVRIGRHGTDSEQWHRDGVIYTGGKAYSVGTDGTEFAVGNGFPFLDRLPNQDFVPTHAITEFLIGRGKLRLFPVPAGKVAVFDKRHFHRAPKSPNEDRIVVLLDVYSQPIALEGLQKSITGRFQLWRAYHNDPFNF